MAAELAITIDTSQLDRELDEISIAELMTLYCAAGCEVNRMVEQFEISNDGRSIVFGMRLKRQEG